MTDDRERLLEIKRLWEIETAGMSADEYAHWRDVNFGNFEPRGEARARVAAGDAPAGVSVTVVLEPRDIAAVERAEQRWDELEKLIGEEDPDEEASAEVVAAMKRTHDAWSVIGRKVTEQLGRALSEVVQ